MNLHEAEKLANELMIHHQLTGWKFQWIGHKTIFGRCTHNKMIIALSSYLTAKRELHEVRNTILHEIAHALVGHSHGHDAVWQRKALEIGCDGKRCGVLPEEAKKDAKYLVACDGCGRSYPFFRKPSPRYESAHAWHRCGGGKEGKMRIIENK